VPLVDHKDPRLFTTGAQPQKLKTDSRREPPLNVAHHVRALGPDDLADAILVRLDSERRNARLY
jgi:hypothetical protein